MRYFEDHHRRDGFHDPLDKVNKSTLPDCFFPYVFCLIDQ